jgi:lipopolysaccharide/colanic/teichoic acid biosynthesis glycosyltransferase
LRALKRALDLVIGSAAVVLLAPLLAGIALAVRLSMGPPVLLRQWRPGFRGRPFEILKFRTMLDLRDAQGQLLPDFQRQTQLGRLLRTSSLDELPELFNLLRGEMSLVGPRPLLMEYLGRYTPEQARRHDVLPGITGWAQVNGRNGNSWEERFRLDLWYVDHWSLWLDFRILGLTAWRVLRREGINAAQNVTMPKYMGPEEGRGAGVPPASIHSGQDACTSKP